jgi:hypothetical protein
LKFVLFCDQTSSGQRNLKIQQVMVMVMVMVRVIATLGPEAGEIEDNG